MVGRDADAMHSMQYAHMNELTVRLNRLQDIVKLYGLDALIFVCGIDGGYNDGSRAAINYLFFNRSGHDAVTSFNDMSTEEDEDLVVCIERHGVAVYCNPYNYKRLLTRMAPLSGISIHCLTNEEYRDIEAAEDFKIRSFISMTRKYKRVGMPLTRLMESSNGSTDSIFDVHEIEEWPLVQAFALEDYGSNGFFTMHRTVISITKALMKVCGRVDVCALMSLVEHALPMFESHWNSSLAAVDLLSPSQRLTNVTEEFLIEPLLTYFRFGHIGDNSTSLTTDYPIALIGVRSVDGQLASCKDITVENGGIDGNIATHVVVEASDPIGPLFCARTFFFIKDGKESHDLRVIRSAYDILVNVILSTKYDVIKASRTNEIESEAMKLCEAHEILKTLNIPRVSVTCKFIDLYGKPIVPGEHDDFLCRIKLQFDAIPSVERNTEFIGSVVYGETFAVSSGTTISLTASIPNSVTWSVGYSDDPIANCLRSTKALDTKRELFSCYGEYLMNGTVRFLNSNGISSELAAYFFEKALIMDDKRLGIIILNISDGVRLFHGTSIDTTAVIIFPSSSISNGDLGVNIALSARNKTRRGFFRDVLPIWRAFVETAVNLPKQLLASYNTFMHTSDSPIEPDTFSLAEAKVPGLKRILNVMLYGKTQNFDCDSSVWPIAEQQEIGIEDLDIEENDDDCIVVTILTGLPGSGKSCLSASLTSLSAENTVWMTLEHHGVENTSASFAGIWKGGKSKKGKEVRVMLITEGYVDVLPAIQSVMQAPHFRIGSVICCIDPRNVFFKHRTVFPMLLRQAACGLASSIVILNCDKVGSNHLNDVTSLLLAANQVATLLRAPTENVTNHNDVEALLSKYAFNRKPLPFIRAITFPSALDNPKVTPPLYPPPNWATISVTFVGALDSERLKIQSRALLNDQSKRIFRIRGTVLINGAKYPQELQFTRCSNYFSLTTLTMPIPPSPKDSASRRYTLLFSGCDLTIEALRDWIRHCVPPPPTQLKLKSIDTITSDERAAIIHSHALAPLPEGWFFTGTKYINMDGDSRIDHPQLDSFLTTYIEENNAAIEKTNAKIRSTPVVGIC